MRRIARFFAGPTEPDPRIGFGWVSTAIFVSLTVAFFQGGETWWGVLGILVVAGNVDRVVRDALLRRRRRHTRSSAHPGRPTRA